MKLLLLTKRHFMAKDIIREEFGRYYELGSGLSALGWDIKSYCLDYRSHWGREVVESGGIAWHTYSVPSFLLHWHANIKREIRRWRPDAVLASSDPIHIAAGLKASRLVDAPLAVDLHDNLESFRLTGVPGLLRSLRSAVGAADLVSCVSGPLRAKVARDYEPRGQLLVLENAIPKTFEKPRLDKAGGRELYGLRQADRVIGVAGALYRKRGIETILAGFDILRNENPDLVLALAGPTDESRRGFSRDGIRYFGNLDYPSMPAFLRMLDIGIVPNIRPVFADYCYPQKAVELCAMSVPIVAADLGIMRNAADGHPQILYQPRDPEDLARAVRYQLDHRLVLDMVVNTWTQQSKKLHQSLLRLLH